MDEPLYGYWLPVNGSAHGGDIDRLIFLVHLFMAALFVGWSGFLGYCLLRFRARKGHAAKHAPIAGTFTRYAEGGVILTELLLLFAVSTPLWFQYKLARPDESQALHIRVVAEQYAWNFQYPGRDGKFGRASLALTNSDNPLGLDPDDPAGKDDITSINQLHIPLGKPVILDISSKDVVHGFNIPVMRVKQDAIPGQLSTIWFTPTRPGHFEIACAQLCGLGHYRMRGDLFVDSPADYAKWEQENAPAVAAPPAPAPNPTPTPAPAPEQR